VHIEPSYELLHTNLNHMRVLVETGSYKPANGQDVVQLSVNPHATDAPKLYGKDSI
jgi:hypothetical protein